MYVRFFKHEILLLLVMVVITACARHVREANYTVPNAAFDLVVACDSSDFKDTVRNQLIEGFKDKANIRVVAIDELKQLDPADYEVVVIMDTCKAWGGFNTVSKHFLDRPEPLQNVVLFMTAGDPDWQYHYRGVDAITSASVVENVPGVVHRLNTRINEILSSKNK